MPFALEISGWYAPCLKSPSQESTSVRENKQPIICKRCRGAIKREKVDIGHIREKLENSGIMSPEEKEELPRRNWPEHLFTNTKTKKGNPFIGTLEDGTPFGDCLIYRPEEITPPGLTMKKFLPAKTVLDSS
jgi:hypothetical protein